MIIIALGVVLIVLKTQHMIDISWMWVLAPFWIPWAWMILIGHADRIVMRHARRMQRLRRVLFGRSYTYRTVRY